MSYQILFYIVKNCKFLLCQLLARNDSTPSKKSELVLEIPKGVEACPLELAPTSSTTCNFVLGDALALALLKKRNFTSKDFLELHPGGKLGKMLLKVGDVMKKEMIPLIDFEQRVSEAILK